MNVENWEDLWAATANKSYVRRSPRQWPTDNQWQGFRNFPCQRYLLSCWPCFSEWPLNFATMEGADKREILCWPAFPNVPNVSIRLLHFTYCTLNRGTGGLAILVQLHSMQAQYNCTLAEGLAPSDHRTTLGGRCSHLSDQQILGARRTRDASTYSLQALLNWKLLAHPGKICIPAFLFDLYSLRNLERYLYKSLAVHVCRMASPCGMSMQTGFFTCDWETGLNGTSYNPKVTYEQTFPTTVFPCKPMPSLRKYSLENEALRGQTDTQHANTPRGPSDTFQTAVRLDLPLQFKFETEPWHQIESCLFVWPMPPSGSSAHQYFKSQSAFLRRARSDEWRVIGAFHKP